MIKVVCRGHEYAYEIKELLKLFYDPQEISVSRVEEDGLESEISYLGVRIESKLDVKEGLISVKTEIYYEGTRDEIIEDRITENHTFSPRKISKLLIKRGIYQLLQKAKKTDLPWGILIGIRPTKIVHELMEEGYPKDEILRILQEDYFIRQDKGKLLLSVAETEYPYIYPIDEDKISIYISIPFCPTRCVYCSFPSNTLKKWGHLQDKYVEALCQEIEETSKFIHEKGKKIETLYIGGGTPSTLSVDQMKRLFYCLENSFQMKEIIEFTFEAGRPDTIDEDKLVFLKNHGVSRLSINPQTMNDCTLGIIGRNHTVEDLKEAYWLAQRVGFNNINMDLIIGLPGEDAPMVEHTMKELKELNPINLTVHTLAVKRTSRLQEDKESYSLEAAEITKMLEITKEYAESMGLKPYYMYRQKHMLGHLENIGYSKSGFEGIYNIQIMEEKQTIIAFGAGAVSKFVYPKENRLERVPNIKDLEQYLVRVEEMVERKKKYI